LTLNSGKWTTGRRSKPVPQLQCIGGHCAYAKPQSVQCYNRGSDGADIQWECKTEMNNKYRLGKMDVICEGYDYADDDYVLVGSCGLEYTIDLVDDNKQYNSYGQQYQPKSSNSFSFGFIICAIFAIFVIYYTCLRPNHNTNNADHRSSASAPPPPPGFRSDYFDDGCGSSSSGYSSNRNERSGAYNANPNNGSGFLSGIMTGGALGYLFGSRTNTTNYSDQSSYFGSRTSPPPYFQSSSNSESSTKTGFAGTKRR